MTLSIRFNKFTFKIRPAMHHSFKSVTELHSSQNERAFFYVDQKVLKENLQQWKSKKIDLQIAYSLKANYDDKILAYFAKNAEFLEVASLDEFELASHYISTNLIFVNGPIYTKNDLQLICSSGALLIIDSLTQLKIINDLQEVNKRSFRLGVRVRMNGFPSTRFGISENELIDFKEQLNRNSTLELLHCHYCDGFRTPVSFSQRIVYLEKVRKEHFPNVKHINIGGGYYSEMPKELAAQFDEPIPTIKEYLDEIQKHFFFFFQLTTEIGSALVANAVDYICRVEDIKSDDKKLLIITNGSKWDIKPNGSLKNLPFRICSEKPNKNKNEAIQIVGYTCMENDVLFHGEGEVPKIGDFLIFKNCGAYAQSLSPDFITNRKKTV